MCFSAGASFAAATLLSAIGIYTMRKTESRSQFAFAAIPFLFATQQFSEGIFWLSSAGTVSTSFGTSSVMVFLLFAQVIWPAWVPLSVFLTETNKHRKRILSVFLIAGLVLAAYHLYCLFTFPVGAEISGHHVAYWRDFPASNKIITSIVYILVTIVPLIVSSSRRIRILGLVLFISFVITIYFYTQHFISVWCFFAAVISGIVLWVLSERSMKRVAKEPVMKIIR